MTETTAAILSQAGAGDKIAGSFFS